jgi:SAM-dependent methyltransferase
MVLYDKIGGDYDRTRGADPYIAKRIISHLGAASDMKCLDIACGTGNYAIALRRSGVDICGMDQSERMVALARRKDSSVPWFVGNVKALPFPNESFSGVTCVLAIHHFDDLQLAFKEVARVISNGIFVIFTSTSEQMRGYWLNEYFPEAMKKSIEQMPSKMKIMNAMKHVGFESIEIESYEIRDDLEDLFLYCGKNHPEFYLDSLIRMGISTFAVLANSREVEKGCALLATDIGSGRIHEVMRSYKKQSDGDYMFVIGQK